MQFFVNHRNAPKPEHHEYPYVLLTRDNWDDYGFKTLFRATIHLEPGNRIALHDVKILQMSQTEGRTPLEDSFSTLDDTYCSLGQELAYYERLQELPIQVRDEYLGALQDAAANPSIAARFSQEPGFGTSLLRSGPAARALEDALALLQDNLDTGSPFDFTFHTKFGSNAFGVTFRFSRTSALPGRLNAVIGYNGTGKTQLLANLAWVAKADLRSRADDPETVRHGHLTPPAIRFGRVIAVSYSAFDTFDLPHTELQEEQDRHAGYIYCGLRHDAAPGQPSGLKDPKDIADELSDALKRVDTKARRRSLERSLQALREEPSFKRAGYELDLLGETASWRSEFDSLSTGHKISINIIVQLIGALQHNSLVLIDEPEAHLHPPLLAALMKGIATALEHHSSVAIVATHSPVVLQEIAGCYAHVIRRHGSLNSVVEPSIETFAENIGLLTAHVFNLDNSQGDFMGVLRSLAESHSIDEIEELFDHGLSSQGRALVLQAKKSKSA